MAEALQFSEKKEAPKKQDSPCGSNIFYARRWYKFKTWHRNMKIALGKASASGRSMKNALLTISFQPDFGVKWPNMAIPISTFLTEEEFRSELEEAYKQIHSHALRMDELDKAGKLKKYQGTSETDQKGFIRAPWSKRSGNK